MHIECTTLLTGTEQSIGEGRNHPFRAQVRSLAGNGIFSAICKRLSPQKIAAECFAALILHGWGISTAAPCLVISDNGLFYGSRESSYPNLKQQLSWDNALPDEVKRKLIACAALLIASWAQTSTVIAADEAIANLDRHIGQILWDGGEPVWIDHDQSLGLADAHLPDRNLLAGLLVKCELHGPIQNQAISQSRRISGHDCQPAQRALDRAISGIPIAFSYPDFADFVSLRLPALAARVLARFPNPALYPQRPP